MPYILSGKNKLTVYILIAMIAGVLLGYIVHEKSSPAFIISFSENIKSIVYIGCKNLCTSAVKGTKTGFLFIS